MNYAELSANIQAYLENTFPDTGTWDGQSVTSADQINTFIKQAEQRIYNTVQFPSIRKNVTGLTTSSNKYLSSPSDFLSVYSMAVVDATGRYEYLLNKDVNFIRQAYPNPTSTGIPKYYALFGPTTTNTTPANPTTELSFILGPTPDAAYSVELHYYYYPESIVQGQVTSVGSVVGGSGYTNGTYYNVPLSGGSGSGVLATITVTGGQVSTVAITNGGIKYVVGDSFTVAASDIGGTGSGFSASAATVSNVNGTTWLGDNIDSVLLYGALVEAAIFMKVDAQTEGVVLDTKYKEAMALAKRLGDGLERQDAYRSGQFRQAVT